MMDKRAELTWTQIMLMIIILAFLIWALVFNGKAGRVFKDGLLGMIGLR